MYPEVLLEEFVYLSVILESIGEKWTQTATRTHQTLVSTYTGQQELGLSYCIYVLFFISLLVPCVVILSWKLLRV